MKLFGRMVTVSYTFIWSLAIIENQNFGLASYPEQNVHTKDNMTKKSVVYPRFKICIVFRGKGKFWSYFITVLVCQEYMEEHYS